MQSSSQKFQKCDDNAPVAEPCVTQHKKTFHLVVKTLTGKKIEILTDLHDTIKTVKSIIQEQENIRINQQKLLFGGRKLDDNKKLHNYNIKTGDWIYLVIRNKEDDDDESDDNENEEEEEAAETETDNKEENKSTNEKEAGKVIGIEHEDQIIFTINIEKGDTIKDVKKKIQAKADIVNPRFIYEGKRMIEDDKTVEDYKFFPENKIKVQGELKLKVAYEFMLNIIYQQTVRQQQVTSSTLVKEIRHIASELLRDPFILLSDGKVLSDENASLGSYGIEKTVDVIVISESNGGNALKFMLFLEGGAPLQNPSELKDSLSFLDDQQGLNEIFAQELENIKAMANSKSYRVEELLAVRLWTSNILSKQLNDCLAGNKDLGPWRIYLKNLINGLRHMNFFRGKAYKGVKGHPNLENYEKGTKVSWKTMTGLTKNRQGAKDAVGNNGTIFEIDVVSARDISKYSLSSLEGLALLPFSCFEVMDVVTASDQPMVIKLRELPVVRGSRLLVWADDNPEYNYYHAQPLEEKGISVVFCTSTKDAVELFESQSWLLSLDASKFRIVSDMVRDENGKPNYIAGIELLKILVDKFKCQVSAMIFCNNLQKAKENAEKENLKGNYYQIVNQDDELEKFLNFS